MPGEEIDRPNPQPLASHIPDSVNELAVKLEKIKIPDNELRALEDFRRASNYIAAGSLNIPIPDTAQPAYLAEHQWNRS
jgi:xylulose-5-phosphate/fructose-6-phosphate phosphoketolase